MESLNCFYRYIGFVESQNTFWAKIRAILEDELEYRGIIFSPSILLLFWYKFYPNVFPDGFSYMKNNINFFFSFFKILLLLLKFYQTFFPIGIIFRTCLHVALSFSVLRSAIATSRIASTGATPQRGT